MFASIEVVSITIQPMTVRWLSAIAIPVLIAIVTRANASATKKGVAMLACASLSSLLQQAIRPDGSAVFTQMLLNDAAMTFVMAVGAYVGWWKGRDLNNSPLVKPGSGIG